MTIDKFLVGWLASAQLLSMLQGHKAAGTAFAGYGTEVEDCMTVCTVLVLGRIWCHAFALLDSGSLETACSIDCIVLCFGLGRHQYSLVSTVECSARLSSEEVLILQI